MDVPINSRSLTKSIRFFCLELFKNVSICQAMCIMCIRTNVGAFWNVQQFSILRARECIRVKRNHCLQEQTLYA